MFELWLRELRVRQEFFVNASGWIDHRPTVPPVQIELSGLPHAVQCPSWYWPHQCPFWIGSGAGGDVVELPDGSALITTVVTYLSGHTLNPPEACGVFIFRSTDKPQWGRWRYLGTVATAAQFPQNGEGPNENAITLLADGKTLSVVFRLDSESPAAATSACPVTHAHCVRWMADGDGVPLHPEQAKQAPYHQSFSTDCARVPLLPCPLAL